MNINNNRQIVENTIKTLNKHNAKQRHLAYSTKTELKRLNAETAMYEAGKEIPGIAQNLIHSELKTPPKMSLLGKIVKIFRPYKYTPGQGKLPQANKKYMNAFANFQFTVNRTHPKTGEVREEIAKNGTEKTREKGLFAPIEKWMNPEEKKLQSYQNSISDEATKLHEAKDLVESQENKIKLLEKNKELVVQERVLDKKDQLLARTFSPFRYRKTKRRKPHSI